MEAFSKVKVHMLLKVHLMRSYLEWLERQLSSECDKHGEHIRQIVVSMEAPTKKKI